MLARTILVNFFVGFLGGLCVACGESGDSTGSGGDSGGASGSSSGGASKGGTSGANGGSSSGKGGTSSGGSGGSTSGGTSNGGSSSAGSPNGGSSSGGGGSSGVPTCDELPGLIDAYKTAHPGNDGADADINALSPSELAADADAQRLMSICGTDQRPIIPLIAWEYGGGDHAWINPEESALAYCVYTPADPATDHWSYDMDADHVEADVSVVCPDQNPCRDETGADQVMACLGDDTNIEIIVDTASYNDGMDVGLDLSEATTDLYLIETSGERIHLYTGL